MPKFAIHIIKLLGNFMRTSSRAIPLAMIAMKEAMTHVLLYDAPLGGPLAKPLAKMKTASRFPAKMTLVFARSLLFYEKISYSQSFSS